jgi:hypothetical protein
MNRLLGLFTCIALLMPSLAHPQQTSLHAIANSKPGINVQSLVISSVRDFGARGDGRFDDSPAIQLAINANSRSKPCILFPPGIYRLAMPIKLSGGECLKGENAGNLGGTTVLLPATAAFVTANPLSQLQSVTLSGFLIRGGTNAIDLGLFHEVDISDITCEDQSGWCFSHVRGERHRIRNIFCWHNTVPGQGCLSFADITHSVFAVTYANANWTDQWWDRSIIDHVTDMGGPTATDQYTLWSNGGVAGQNGSFSNSNVRLVLSHNAGQTSPIRMVNVQLSEFHNIVTDAVGKPDRPAPVIFDVEGFFLYSSIDGFYPNFSGNSHWTTGLYFKKLFLGSSVKNCSVGGDNKSTFGIRFAQAYGNYGELSACDGSYYNESTNALWRDQISIVGSNLSPVNNGGNINLVDKTDTGASITLMSDGNGAHPAKSSFRVMRATGNGTAVQDFVLSASGASVRLPFSAEGGLVEPNPATPVSSKSACAKGSIRWDSDFIYVCTAPSTWKRSALSRF